jgi:hypothetical protein
MTAYIGSTEVVLLHIRDIPQSLAPSERKGPAIKESRPRGTLTVI